jgi:hypothetical protein
MRMRYGALGLACLFGGTGLALSLTRSSSIAAPTLFQGTYRGASSMPNSTGAMTEVIAASGSASVIGISTMHATSTSGALNPGGCIPFTGRGRLNAAGSGSLNYRYSISPCFRPVIPGARPLTGRYTITGGSGRFRGARGSGTYMERYRTDSGWQAPPGQVAVTFHGTLRLP